MDKLFLAILNMSLTGAFVIAAVCLTRLMLKKAPKIISYCLWAVAGFRLVFPFSIESVFSLLPFKAQPIPQTELLNESVSFGSAASAALHAIGDAANGGLGTVTVYLGRTADGYPITTEAYHSQVWLLFFSYIWIAGVAAMLIYGMVSYALLKHKMRSAIRTKENIYESDIVQSPFVLNVFKPKIYIPLGLLGKELEYIILHERTHIRRHDHIIKSAAYLILCLHWFNPLAWLAFMFMGVDMEMSCDERVLKEMGTETKKDYAMSMLSLAANRRIIGGSPLAFSEGGLKQRIKNVMNFKKPSRVIITLAVALVAILSVGFAVNRAGDKADYAIPEIVATENIDGAQAKLLCFGYSWYDGKNGTVADAIATWQGEYTEEYTLIIDGEMGQNMIALSAENPLTASYIIYLPDGRVYDNGTRSVYDSLSSRLYRFGDKNGIGVIAPFEPGEYIYEVTLGWIKEDLRVTSTYGFKLIMTGKRSAYDEALDMVWDYHSDALSASFKGVETLPGAEYAGDCYVFEVELPDGIQRAAVSKEHDIFFTYSDGIWLRTQDMPKLKQPVLPYLRDAVSTQHEAFYAVVLKLYEMDSGLNGGIKYIAIDMAGVFESERAALQADLLIWVSSVDCELLIGSYSDLVESGYITQLPQKGEQIDVNTNYGFNDGILFGFTDGSFDGETLTVNANKYRGPLGAVGAEFTARFADGVWIVDEPEMVLMA